MNDAIYGGIIIGLLMGAVLVVVNLIKRIFKK